MKPLLPLLLLSALLPAVAQVAINSDGSAPDASAIRTLAFDKTGTLTVNELTIDRAVLPSGESFETTGAGIAPGTVENAAEAVRSGVADYLQKPFDVVQVSAAVYRALGRHEEAVDAYRQAIERDPDLASFLAEEFADAVADGKIARLGVDVLQREPIRDDHPFLELDNVIVLPHVGSYTERSLRLMDEKNVEDVEKVVRGTVPDEIANPDVLVRGTRAEVAS